jgi:hypothetical protein
MVPHCQTLIAMCWSQPKSPNQMDNSTAAGATNKTIVPHRSKMTDMRLWWLHCRTSQDQFRYYWDAGAKNWANYHTKHHPDTYHGAHQSLHAGYWSLVGTEAHSPLSPNHELMGFPTQAFPYRISCFLFPYISHVCLQAEHYFPHIVNVAARVCRSPISWVWADHPQI